MSRIIRPLGAAMLAALSLPAVAGDLLPTARLGFQFGGNAGITHLSANFGSAWLEPELGITRPLPLTDFHFDSNQGLGGNLLGVPLRAPVQVLRQEESEVVSVQEETSGWSGTWLWVALGVAALATVDVSTSSNDEDNDGNGPEGSSNDSSCNYVGGNLGGEGGPYIDVIGPNCPGMPGIRIPP